MPPGLAVDGVEAGDPAVLQQQVARLDVVQGLGAAAAGPAQRLDEQARRVGGHGVVPQGAAAQAVAVHPRAESRRLDGVEQTVGRHPAVLLHPAVALAAQQLVGRKGEPESGAAAQATAARRRPQGHQAGERLDQVGEVGEQPAPLGHRFAVADEVESLQVTQPAVDDAQAARRGGGTEVVALDEQGGEAAA